MKNNIITHHANTRIFERTYFNEDSLLKLMNSKSYFYLGHEFDSNIGHYLVYQCTTDEFFVVIKDNDTHRVITILPIEYHAKFESKLKKQYVVIDKELKRRAKLAATSKLTSDDLCLKIKLKVSVINSVGLHSSHNIKKIEFSTEKYINFTKSNKKAQNILNTWLKKNKGLEVTQLHLSIGRESPIFIFDYENSIL